MSEVKAICNAHCFNGTPQHNMKSNTTSSSKKRSLKVFTFHNSISDVGLTNPLIGKECLLLLSVSDWNTVKKIM